MTQSSGIIVGALIIGAAIIGMGFVPRYQIADARNAVGNPFVWRLDTRTGAMEACIISANTFDKIGSPVSLRCQSANIR